MTASPLKTDSGKNALYSHVRSVLPDEHSLMKRGYGKLTGQHVLPVGAESWAKRPRGRKAGGAK